MKYYPLLPTDANETYIKPTVPIVAAPVASGNTLMGGDGVIRIDVPNTAGNYDTVMTTKVRIVDAWFICTGVAPAAGDTVRVLNITNAVTDAKAMGTTATARLGFTTFDSTYWEIAAGGTLRITAAKNTNCACTVYVKVISVT